MKRMYVVCALLLAALTLLAGCGGASSPYPTSLCLIL
jgi:ABC-type glycerol-3-phosphate transport system substrate-binding protein